MDYEGKVIEFLSGGGLRLALVTRHTKEKLQVIDERGKYDRVSVNHVVLVHDARANSDEFNSLAVRIMSDIDHLRQEIDTELLWESVLGESREFDIEELAKDYYGSHGSLHLSALFRALAEDRLHFKRKGLHFLPRTAHQVTEQLMALQRRREREAFRQRALLWIQQVLNADEEMTVPLEMVSLLQQMEDFLLRKKTNEVPDLLSQISDGLTVQEAAFQVLVRTGRLSADADPFLVIAGIEERTPRKVEEQADRLTGFQVEDGRRHFSTDLAFSIDDEETLEVDDALTVEVSGDGLRIGIHIADVTYFVAKADLLDEQAHRRTASVYLPTRRVPMFPERLAYDLASLKLDQWRPTMSFEVEIGETGEVRAWRLSRGQLRVSRRLSYVEADKILRSSPADEVAVLLRRLEPIARQLRDRRLAHGAVIIRRPELKVHVQGEQISLKVIDPHSPSRQIISEFMILANGLAAEYAVRESIPVIFRTQDPPTGEIPSQGLEIPYDPLALQKVLKGMKRSRLSLMPQPHAGLGLNAYTQVTSPIRRFADVVIQRQMAAHLAGEPLPYERDELMEVLGTAESVERDLRAMERQATRFWVLKYLACERSNDRFDAVVVDQIGGGWILELTDFSIRGILPTNPECQLGSHVRVGIEKVDPKRDVLRLKRAD